MTGKAVRLLQLPVVNYGGSPLQIVRTQQNDANSRVIKAVIFDDAGYVNLAGYTVTLACIIDGQRKIYGDVNNQGNYTIEVIYKDDTQSEVDVTYARVLIPSEVMLEVGSVESQLCFTKKDGTKLTTQSFYILVDECPTGGIINDDKNYDILSKIIMNEEGRMVAEKNRETAETKRETAEVNRENQEKIRQTKETERQTAETSRVQEESKRVATFDTMSKQYAENISKVEKLTQPIDNKLAGGVGTPSLEIDPVTGGLVVKNLKGETGTPNMLTIGDVKYGEIAKATIIGNPPNQILNLVLPRGEKGEQGLTGQNGQNGTNGKDGVSITKVVAGNPSVSGDYTITPITITLSNGQTQTINVSAKKGEQGIQGIAGKDGVNGTNGTNGKDGAPNTLKIGTVQAGTTASATITGTAPNQTLNLVLPKGEKGKDGANGTAIKVNGVAQSEITFTTDPQEQIDKLNGIYLGQGATLLDITRYNNNKNKEFRYYGYQAVDAPHPSAGVYSMQVFYYSGNWVGLMYWQLDETVNGTIYTNTYNGTRKIWSGWIRLPEIVQSYKSSDGSVRWRKWNDGLIEYWINMPNGVSSHTFTGINFTTTNYSVFVGFSGSVGGTDTKIYYPKISIKTKSTTSISFQDAGVSGITRYIYVAGY